MKDEWRLFAGGAVIVAATAALYWFITYEQAGSVLLSLCGGALALVAGWLFLKARGLEGPRPEDGDAEPGEGAEEIGYFPSSSIWPFVAGSGVVVLSVGLVFGVWLSLFGGILLAVATLGFAVEANSKG